MSLFSFLRKNEQESTADDGAYHSRAEEDSKAVRSRKRKSTSRREEAMDPVLPEKKRARRRLVGAVALVLAAVIGLPMVLDSEPKPLAEDIVIQIPSRDSLPPLAPPGTPPAVATDTSSSKSEADAVALSLDAKEELVTTPPPSNPISPAKPAVAEPPAPPAAPAPPAPAPERAQQQPASPSSGKPAPRSPDGARALALLEGRGDSGKEAAGGEKFVIQVAALVSQQKVNELQDKLKRAGIASFTQTVPTQSGTATRIRVGPFNSREEAEKMRARITTLGLSGSLVPA